MPWKVGQKNHHNNFGKLQLGDVKYCTSVASCGDAKSHMGFPRPVRMSKSSGNSLLYFGVILCYLGIKIQSKDP
jgi:hypothetical protein